MKVWKKNYFILPAKEWLFSLLPVLMAFLTPVIFLTYQYVYKIDQDHQFIISEIEGVKKILQIIKSENIEDQTIQNSIIKTSEESRLILDPRVKTYYWSKLLTDYYIHLVRSRTKSEQNRDYIVAQFLEIYAKLKGDCELSSCSEIENESNAYLENLLAAVSENRFESYLSHWQQGLIILEKKLIGVLTQERRESYFFLLLTSLLTLLGILFLFAFETKNIRAKMHAKHLATELKSKIHENHFILNALGIGVWKFLPQTNELHWDESLYKLYGINPKDFSGHYQAWESSLTQQSKKEAVAELEAALKGEKEFNTTFEVKTQDGHKKMIGGRAFIERDQFGQPVRMYGINWDRTKELETEVALHQERAKALHASQLATLGEMSAGIAHEINNPLGVIMGTAGILESLRHDDQQFKRKLEMIEKSVEKIAKIVSSLRRFARAESESHQAMTMFSSILNEVQIMSETRLKKSFINFQIFTHRDFEIFVDSLQIEQVLLNLVNNAIDAVERQTEKWIKICTSETEKEFIIQVVDSGPGIDKDLEKKIFEPFFTTKGASKGTGLGLSICRDILKEHSGTLNINREYKETCFEIRLPRTY